MNKNGRYDKEMRIVIEETLIVVQIFEDES